MADAAMSTRPILSDADNSWNRVPYQVSFGERFMSMADALRYAADVYDGQIKHANTAGSNGLGSDQALAEFLGTPNYIGKPYFKDTRLGANDAINCLWQFNRDDDIVHPMMRSEASNQQNDDHGIGMGRVYAATIEQNQSIAWFTFGVARFTKLADFYLRAFNADLVKLNNTGFNSALEGLGHLFGTLGGLAFALPLLPLKWIVDFASRSKDYGVDRFYDLRTTMHLYYKYVDSILAEWLVNVGIYGNGSGSAGDGNSWTADPASLPLALRETGPSIYDINARKAKMLGVDPGRNTEAFQNEISRLIKMKPEEYDEDSSNPWNNNFVDWKNVVKDTALGATQFIGFRIEKNVDASESFSNSTAPSAFAEQINNMSRDNMARSYDFGSVGESATDIVSDISKGVSSLLSGLTGGMDINGLASAMVGGAFIDIPESYRSSDFSKSHSLSFQLRAPYGDITSIYQSIMVPLACLLAGVLPRASGPNSYTQPFLCRVYCKGMFSIPLGIIDSLSLKRGSSEFGWTYQNLPTAIDVSMSIKDLSPIMYMAMADKTLENIFGTNNSFNEYMLTLAGTGLFERVSRFAQLRRKVQLSSHKIRNQIVNPMFWASSIADSWPATAIASCVPWNKVSHN